MTRDHLATALNEGIPFAIRMADGKSYTVHERHQMALGKTTVVVIDEVGLAHVLPLLTVTGISYLKNESPDNN